MSGRGVRSSCLNKLATEWEYLRCQSCEPLSTFMDYVVAEYQLGTVLTVLKATTGTAALDGQGLADLLSQCHPLGQLDDASVRVLSAFSATAAGLEDLYSTVLIDTPVGKYFAAYLTAEAERSAMSGTEEVRSRIAEVSLAVLENTLMKLYLEDFHAFCKSLGGGTAEIMCPLLEARADIMTINITYHSLGGVFSNVRALTLYRSHDRTHLLFNFTRIDCTCAPRCSSPHRQASACILGPACIPSWARCSQLGR